MSSSSINGLATSIESTLTGAFPKTNAAAGTTASSQPQTDSSQLSPLGQILSTLQQIRQSNPTEYKQVTQQIATDLTAAAQTAQSDGNAASANQLTQLAADFTNASTAGGHHHHRSEAAAANPDPASSAGSAGQIQNDTPSAGTENSIG